MRLIDADKLIELTQKDMKYAFDNGFLDMAFEREHLIKVIRNQPTAYDIDKVVEQLEEKTEFLKDCTKYGNKNAEQQNKSYSTMMMYEVADLVDDLIEIVKQEAEQYNNGWIPCSEPPKDDRYVLLSFENFSVPMVGRYEEDENGGSYYIGDEMEPCVTQDIFVNAWQPLPEPYQPKGE